MSLHAFCGPPPTALDERRLSAAAALRNRDPILAVLRRLLPPGGTVLEVASGTGEHVTHFAAALPHLVFQPSDPEPELRASAAAWAAHLGLGNVLPALDLDVFAPWPGVRADAVFCSNMIHVAPPEALPALVERAAAVLPAGGALLIYGPFRVHGQHVSESNVTFEAQLRARDPRWGVRDVDDVAAAGAAVAMEVDEIVEMPANNRIVVVRRRG